MSVLSIRNVPDDLDVKLRALADADRRSVNAEALVLLEEAVANRLDDMSPARQEAMGL